MKRQKCDRQTKTSKRYGYLGISELLGDSTVEYFSPLGRETKTCQQRKKIIIKTRLFGHTPPGRLNENSEKKEIIYSQKETN